MKRWPNAWLVWVGGTLIVAVNAVVLGGAWYNRSSEPQVQLQLTERELALPHRAFGWREENSGLSLQLAWSVGRNAVDEPFQYGHLYGRHADWLDADTLRGLGFELPTGLDSTEEKRGGAPLSRSVWLLLEFDGDSYQQTLRDTERWVESIRTSAARETSSDNNRTQLVDAEKTLWRLREVRSRLFVIDAGLDPGTLRRRYPDATRFLIARGQVRVAAMRSTGEAGRYRGYIDSVHIDNVHVSTRFRPIFDAVGPRLENDAPPRYVVTLASGRRFEPWIVHASAMP